MRAEASRFEREELSSDPAWAKALKHGSKKKRQQTTVADPSRLWELEKDRFVVAVDADAAVKKNPVCAPFLTSHARALSERRRVAQAASLGDVRGGSRSGKTCYVEPWVTRRAADALQRCVDARAACVEKRSLELARQLEEARRPLESCLAAAHQLDTLRARPFPRG